MIGMLFTELAMVAILAAVLGIIMDRLRQPTILGYLLAGVGIGLWGILEDSNLVEMLELLGQIGVVLLLFLVGMELSAPKVKSVGKSAVVIGLGQVLFTSGVGWMIAWLLGFEMMTSIYLAVALAFSSTIIVVKLLGEMNDLQSLHGKIAVGFLLVQDIVAILALVVMSAMGSGDLSWLLLIQILIKAVVIIALVWLLSNYLIPRAVSIIAPSPELLFLSSVAWGLGVAAVMVWEPIGFSIEAGGFLAGITLANSGQHHEILARLRPLRDFFIMLFFVVLAVNLLQSEFVASWFSVAAFSIFVLIGNPLIVLVIMRQLGYKARTSFLVSITVAQISEFGLIVVALGESSGQVDRGTLGLTTLVAVITMTLSTYVIWSGPALWRYVKRWSWILEKPGIAKEALSDEVVWKDHVVLIGCDRTGNTLLKQLLRMKLPVVVMDFNPEVAKELHEKEVPVIYGDLEDVDMYGSLGLPQANMIVSTVVNNYEGTLMLLEFVRNKIRRRGLMIIVTATDLEEAKIYYEAGADYVAIPKWVNGVHLGEVISKTFKDGKMALRAGAEKEMGELLNGKS